MVGAAQVRGGVLHSVRSTQEITRMVVGNRLGLRLVDGLFSCHSVGCLVVSAVVDALLRLHRARTALSASSVCVQCQLYLILTPTVR
jgi:hypothetical protein